MKGTVKHILVWNSIDALLTTTFCEIIEAVCDVFLKITHVCKYVVYFNGAQR